MPPRRKRLQSPVAQGQRSKRPKVSTVNSTGSQKTSQDAVNDSLPVRQGMGIHVDEPSPANNLNTLSNIDLNSLTQTITQTVTSAVLSNLQELGVLAAQIATPAVSSGMSNISGAAASQSLARELEISSNLTNSGSSLAGTNLNTSTGIFAASSSLSIPGCADSHTFAEAVRSAHVEASKTGFVSAAIPLHSRVPLKNQGKNMG